MKKLFLCLLVTLATTAFAAATPAGSKQKVASADARVAIAEKFPGVKPEEVRPSPMQGIYEVVMGADIAYVSADGRYIIAGDLYEVDSRINLTEAKRQNER